MKKLMLLCAISAIGFSACKKNYTCTCKGVIQEQSSGNKAVDETQSYTLEDMKKNDAEAECDIINAEYTFYMTEYTDDLNFALQSSGVDSSYSVTANCQFSE